MWKVSLNKYIYDAGTICVSSVVGLGDHIFHDSDLDPLAKNSSFGMICPSCMGRYCVVFVAFRVHATKNDVVGTVASSPVLVTFQTSQNIPSCCITN